MIILNSSRMKISTMSIKNRFAKLFIYIVLFIIITLTFPCWYCGLEANSFFSDIKASELTCKDSLLKNIGTNLNGNIEVKLKNAEKESAAYLKDNKSVILPLAREVADIVEKGISTKDFSTGSARFDGEWQFGTYQMAGAGLAQVIKTHDNIPEKARFIKAIETCINNLLSDNVKIFDKAAWGEDPIETLSGSNGHAAYLGYFNLTLGLYREVAEKPKYNDIHDRITEALVKRLKKCSLKMLQTYPSEVYPVDNTAVIASIAQHSKVTGRNYKKLIGEWVNNCREKYVDKKSGMLIQAISFKDGKAIDKPRASGTALGLYFISFADSKFSKELYQGLKKNCTTDLFGFGLVREYPPNVEQGSGDIDSGPVVMGMSFSGTGFTVGGSRIHHDFTYFKKLYRTVYLLGSPLDRNNRRTYVTGGPLGNSIMLAMFSAIPAEDK